MTKWRWRNLSAAIAANSLKKPITSYHASEAAPMNETTYSDSAGVAIPESPRQKDFLAVSEIFYSIQGEGPSMGRPCVFLRLGGCNLLCGGRDDDGHTWTCDTIDVWKKSRKMSFLDILLKIESILMGMSGTLMLDRLVITGGEPMLQQEALVPFIDAVRELNSKCHIEVETNGTISPSLLMKRLVNQWNVSPKLSNSGESHERRYDYSSAAAFAMIGNAVFWKFVVSSEKDLQELLEDLPVYIFPIDQVHYDEILRNRVFLMPGADTREKYLELAPKVVEWCKRYGFRFSAREHIVIWDKKTGV